MSKLRLAIVEVTEAERSELGSLANRRKTAQVLAMRAQIVLGCAFGRHNKDVASQLGIDPVAVSKRRRRCLANGLDGLRDEPRSGAPRTVDDARIEAVITQTLESLPVRLPLRIAVPNTSLRPLPSPGTGYPRLPASPFQRAVPITPADRVGALVDYFPAHAAFPVIKAGRHPHHHFRGLLRLYTRYGPLDCSTVQGGLCHEASTRPVTQQSRSSATRPIDSYLGGTSLHWCYAPSGRTE